MLKKKPTPKSLLNIRRDEFVLHDDIYKRIESVSYDGNKLMLELEGEIEIEITQDTIGDFEYATQKPTLDGVKAELFYSCDLCHNPSFAFETEHQAQNHAKQCLFNKDKKSCVLCKNLKIIEYPPYPRFQKEYKSLETYHAFGGYKQPYCMLKEKNIDEELLFENHDDCFDYTEEPAVVEQTDEFKKYLDLMFGEDDDLEIEEKEVS